MKMPLLRFGIASVVCLVALCLSFLFRANNIVAPTSIVAVLKDPNINTINCLPVTLYNRDSAG
jgi:hypothetical protein